MKEDNITSMASRGMNTNPYDGARTRRRLIMRMVGNYCCATFISAAVRHVLMSHSTAGTSLSRRRNNTSTLINIITNEGTSAAFEASTQPLDTRIVFLVFSEKR